MGYLGSRVTNWPIGNHFFSFRVHRPPSHGPWQLKSGITSNVCCPFPRHRRRSCSLKGDDKEKNRKHVITQYSFFSKDDDLGDERARSHKGKALLGLTWLQAATKKVKHWRDLDLKALKSRGLAGTLAYGFLNSVYYGLGIIFVWIFISQVPKGLSLNEFTQTLMRVAAYTWAGSQVTKSFRIISAVTLAGHVDKLIDRTANTLDTSHNTIFFMYTLSCFLFVFICVAILASAWIN